MSIAVLLLVTVLQIAVIWYIGLPCTLSFITDAILWGLAGAAISEAYITVIQPNELLGGLGYYLIEQADAGAKWVKPLGICPQCTSFWIGFVLAIITHFSALGIFTALIVASVSSLTLNIIENVTK